MNYEARMAQQDFEGKKSFDTIKKKYMVTQIKLTIFNCRVECTMDIWKKNFMQKMTI